MAATALLCTTFTNTSSRAAVAVAFSGGNGAPLSIALLQPVEYKVSSEGVAATFVFKDPGTSVSQGFETANSSITYPVNGGGLNTVDRINSGFGGNDINPADTYIFGAAGAIHVGDVVTLSAGTLITMSSSALPAPASGSYETLVTGNYGERMSENGASVPEPAALVVLGVAALPLRRRRQSSL